MHVITYIVDFIERCLVDNQCASHNRIAIPFNKRLI